MKFKFTTIRFITAKYTRCNNVKSTNNRRLSVLVTFAKGKVDRSLNSNLLYLTTVYTSNYSEQTAVFLLIYLIQVIGLKKLGKHIIIHLYFETWLLLFLNLPKLHTLIMELQL